MNTHTKIRLLGFNHLGLANIRLESFIEAAFYSVMRLQVSLKAYTTADLWYFHYIQLSLKKVSYRIWNFCKACINGTPSLFSSQTWSHSKVWRNGICSGVSDHCPWTDKSSPLDCHSISYSCKHQIIYKRLSITFAAKFN